MKPIHFAALLALGAGACVDSPPPLQLFQAVAPSANCTVSTSGIGQGAGTLDLTVAEAIFGSAPGSLPGYNIGFRVRSNLENTEVEVNGAPITSEGDTTIYITEMELRYQTEPDLDIPSATVPIYSAFEGGDEGAILTNILSGPAVTALQQRLPATGNQAQVRVFLRLVGKTAGGSDVESNEAEYPILVRRSGINFCGTLPYSTDLDACENPGQDGFVPECEEAE